MDNFRGQETGAGGAVPLLFCVPGKSHSHVGSSGRGQWGGGTTDFVHRNGPPDSGDIFPKYSFSFPGQPKIIGRNKSILHCVSCASYMFLIAS